MNAPERTAERAVSMDDVQAVEGRLFEAAHALRAMYALATEAQHSDDAEHYLTAIRTMARATFKGIDACLVRLTGAPAIGGFASEFDRE
jgi:hypothetical protein